MAKEFKIEDKSTWPKYIGDIVLVDGEEFTFFESNKAVGPVYYRKCKNKAGTKILYMEAGGK